LRLIAGERVGEQSSARAPESARERPRAEQGSRGAGESAERERTAPEKAPALPRGEQKAPESSARERAREHISAPERARPLPRALKLGRFESLPSAERRAPERPSAGILERLLK